MMCFNIIMTGCSPYRHTPCFAGNMWSLSVYLCCIVQKVAYCGARYVWPRKVFFNLPGHIFLPLNIHRMRLKHKWL